MYGVILSLMDLYDLYMNTVNDMFVGLTDSNWMKVYVI